ncbi:organic cation/carnitine transporter 3-like [Prosopis cineraria]|uniref:organic cation/carnitine transporter 3-like n=1 Tax=Prosopis cineraria TaxID=364024 RepID=UPI00240EC166|nr:organic cation/carnitine transporter 3-like [Prosopis cineraria]
MAEPIQSLTQFHSQGTEASPPSLDDMIEQSLGNFGWTQILQSLLVSMAMFFDAQQSFITIYTDAHPRWHCTTSNLTSCSSDSDICKLPRSSWAWDEISSKTIISQWSLECASSFITGLPQSSFFVGCFLAGFLLAAFADSSLGRKNMLFLSCLTMSIASSITVFSTSIWVYSAFKFLIGFCRSSIGACSLVLLTEKVRKEWRFRVAVLMYIWFTLGFLSLPGIAYVNRDSSWKSLYLWTSIPGIFYCIIAYIFVTESPRWLLMQGREKEAMAILKGIATTLAKGGGTSTSRLIKLPAKKSASTINFYSSINELFVTSWALKRLLAVMVLGFGIGMVYFGIPLNVGNLGFNIYLSVVFNALQEIPAFIATYFLDNCRRKPSILGFSVACGICCLICAVIGNELQIVKLCLALVSFFSVCSAFNVLLIYVIELFPTSVRNTTSSMARQAIVFGDIFSPFFISEGRKNDLFSYGIFGVTILSSAFSVLFLTETKGISLCDTMEQQERKESITV